MNICEEQCGKDAECDYEVCPFEHKYSEKDEVMSGYRYVGDPVKDRKIEWAKEFPKTS
jgi:hypothetical protein